MRAVGDDGVDVILWKRVMDLGSAVLLPSPGRSVCVKEAYTSTGPPVLFGLKTVSCPTCLLFLYAADLSLARSWSLLLLVCKPTISTTDIVMKPESTVPQLPKPTPLSTSAGPWGALIYTLPTSHRRRDASASSETGLLESLLLPLDFRYGSVELLAALIKAAECAFSPILPGFAAE